MEYKQIHFLSMLAAVSALLAFHLLLGRLVLERVRRDGGSTAGWRAGIAAAILLLDAPFAHTFLLYKFFNPPILDLLMHRFFDVLLLVHANVAVFGVIALVRRYLVQPMLARRRARRQLPTPPSEPAPAPLVTAIDRRQFITTGALALTGLATSATALRAVDQTSEGKIEQVVIKIPGLPEALKGTTIAMISDIHSSIFMEREDMERYAKELQKLKADMIFLTGDFVNSKLAEVYPMAEAFAGLSAPLGVWGVTGNHDYYSRKIETIAKEIEQAGIKLLRNENVVVEKGGERLWLMGMDDDRIYDIGDYLKTGKSATGTIENLTKGIPENGTKLFLCHKPYPFDEYSQLGIDVMFSGHTHGGQIVLAQLDHVNLSFASLASSYVAGLYRSRTNRKSQLYVTRGIGTVGVPVRLNCPPEITHVVLV